MMTTTNASTHHHISHKNHERILRHYHLAAPLMARLFGGAPLVYAAYPRGLESYVVFHGALSRLPPGELPTIDVATRRGVHTYITFSKRAMETLLAHSSAVEFHGWGCTAGDPARARFGRILLEQDAHNRRSLAEAAAFVSELLAQFKLRAIPLLEGKRGIALWIPLSGSPTYEAVRAVFHAFCREVVKANPTWFSVEPNTIAAGRVHLHVGSNAPGRYSCLPYSLRGDDALPVCAPLSWNELEKLGDGDITAETFPQRLATAGDVFSDQLASIGDQSLPAFEVLRSLRQGTNATHGRPVEPHGHTLRAVAEVLQDGKPRDAKTILADALARHLLPPGTKEKWIYTALLEYIVRTSGHGHKPFVVQDIDRRFRLNEPADDWPPIPPPPVQPPDDATQALIDRLASTAHGADPTAFELAVCDALAHLGFVATHVGGHDNPDGYADAPLGVFGYRTMVECKTGGTVVHSPDAVEASKFKQRFGAAVCAIVGSAFTEKLELVSELQTHGVSAFTVDDVQRLLRIGSNPYEMRPLFEPGFASDRMGDLLWERLHGTAKRVGLICEYLRESGWAAQVAFAKAQQHGESSEAPRLTADAAMLLVDQRLADEGSTAACTRDDVLAAFAHLTSPCVGNAVWSDAKEAIVIAAEPSAPLSMTAAGASFDCGAARLRSGWTHRRLRSG